GVRIDHRSVIDVFAVPLELGTDGELADVGVIAVDRCKLRRERPYPYGMHARAVHQTGHLHATTLREVLDEARVPNVPVDRPERSRLDRVDDLGCVLRTTLDPEVLS